MNVGKSVDGTRGTDASGSPTVVRKIDEGDEGRPRPIWRDPPLECLFPRPNHPVFIIQSRGERGEMGGIAISRRPSSLVPRFESFGGIARLVRGDTALFVQQGRERTKRGKSFFI